jgi:hypothetical protein
VPALGQRKPPAGNAGLGSWELGSASAATESRVAAGNILDAQTTESTDARAAKWVMPQWEVLAAGRVGWDGGVKKVRVNESRGSGGEQE